MRLLNDITYAAGHLSGAGVEQAKIVRARPFRAHRRTSIAQRNASVSREIPSRRRRRAAKPANSLAQTEPVPSTSAALVATATTMWIEQM